MLRQLTHLNFKWRGLIKANHLRYIVPSWYGSRISADCQQKLFSLEHDVSWRFLLVTFLEEQKREDCTVRADRLSDIASLIMESVSRNEKRHQLYIGRGINDGNCIEKFSQIKSVLKFKDNLSCFSWLFDFVSSTIIEDESKCNQIISVNIEKASTISIPTHIKIIQTKKVASKATSTAATNVQPHVQIVKSKSRPLPSIPQERLCGSEQERKTDTRKLEEITADDNEDIYSYDRLVGWANTSSS